MKPTIYTITLFLFLHGFTIGQTVTGPDDNAKGKSFISLNGGMAMPMGKFAATDFSSDASGYAKTGTHFALEGAWFFSKHFGVGGSFATSTFAVNVTPIAAGYLAAFDCDSASAGSKPYRNVSFLIGPYFTCGLKKFSIDVHILGGITNTTSPNIFTSVFNQQTGPTEGSTSTFVQTSSSANAFGFQAGLGVRYSVCKHLAICLGGNYFTSKPQLTYQMVGLVNDVGHTPTGYNQAISGISTTLGIGYEF